MTVNATNVMSGPFYPNGQTINFPFDFEVSDVSEVSAELNGVTLDTSLYAVTLNDDGTGQVTFFIAPAGNGLTDVLYLFSNPNFRQQTTLANQGPYFQKTLEGVLDRLAIRLIWLRDRILRAPVLPIVTDAIVGKFPIVLAGGAFGWSSGPGGGTDAVRDDLADPSVGPNIVMFDQTETYGAGGIGEFILKEIDVTKAPFNAQGNGTNEKVILQAAYALAETLNIPLYLGKDKTYHLGTMSGTVEEVVFGGKGPPKIYGENVKLTAANHATTPQVAYIFSFANFHGKLIQGITVECTNHVSWSNIIGLAAFNVRKLAGGASGLRMRGCVARNVMRGFGVIDVGADPVERVTDIDMGDLRIENAYYGCNFQDDGDNVRGNITVINARRAYFAYGCADHDVDVYVKIVAGGNTLGSTGCILLGRIHKRDMGAMSVRVTWSGDLTRYDSLFYNMNNTADLAGAVAGVVGQIDFRGDLDKTVVAPGNVVRYQLLSFIKDQITETAGLPNIFQGVTLRGNFLDTGQGSAAVAVKAAAPPVGPTYITLDPDTRVSNWRLCVVDPRIVFRLSGNREVRIVQGTAVNGTVFEIPIGHMGRSYGLRHMLYAHDGSAGFGNSTYREDVVMGTVASPSGAVNFPQTPAITAPVGAGATRIGVTFGGGTLKALVTLASATYGNSSAFAKLETTFIGELTG